jgi:hypothetical protein
VVDGTAASISQKSVLGDETAVFIVDQNLCECRPGKRQRVNLLKKRRQIK